MRHDPHFEDYDWRSSSAPAFGDPPRDVVMVDYDDNLLFDDEVVGRALSWSDYAAPTPFDRADAARKKARRK